MSPSVILAWIFIYIFPNKKDTLNWGFFSRLKKKENLLNRKQFKQIRGLERILKWVKTIKHLILNDWKHDFSFKSVFQSKSKNEFLFEIQKNQTSKQQEKFKDIFLTFFSLSEK